MSESVIVEFIGLPGVGKSTLSREVATELETRGTEVHEPIYERDIYSTPRRIASKARLASRSLIDDPKKTLKTTQCVRQTEQQSLSDFIRVTFNLHYVTGVTTTFQSRTGVTLLDQGLYQACWSVGLRSTQPTDEAIEKVDISAYISPDLVVFVEANDATIANRLTNRTDGDTRFTPNSDAFKRARNGYETIKSEMKSASDGSKSITIKNETQESLTPNAARIADIIQSLDE